jgi:hypothetical protein
MMLSSLSKECNHNCSIIMFTIAWYSNYIEEHEIAYCYGTTNEIFSNVYNIPLCRFSIIKEVCQSSHKKNYKVRLVVFENYNPW